VDSVAELFSTEPLFDVRLDASEVLSPVSCGAASERAIAISSISALDSAIALMEGIATMACSISSALSPRFELVARGR
jgi:hypothetical protein